MNKKIELDFSEITTLAEMHYMLKKKFGFPEFYGNNVNALIDCLSCIRRPEEDMCDFTLDSNDDSLIIELKNFTTKDEIIINHFLTAIKAVNDRAIRHTKTPSIYLLLIGQN